MGRSKEFEGELWDSVLQIKKHVDGILDLVDATYATVESENLNALKAQMQKAALFYALLEKFLTRFKYDIGPKKGKLGITDCVRSVQTRRRFRERTP